mmetsp:Transcript_136806/g.262981  ORF Transcript_136806/g.262981 Transcript_136806/m.262981 type:complete len:111 (+) Transcript_136806:239-571(+)
MAWQQLHQWEASQYIESKCKDIERSRAEGTLGWSTVIRAYAECQLRWSAVNHICGAYLLKCQKPLGGGDSIGFDIVARCQTCAHWITTAEEEGRTPSAESVDLRSPQRRD